jgi:hypothetical protein
VVVASDKGEPYGIEWLTETLGGIWVQTSYNGAIRKNFAGIGFTYSETLDAFISPQPFKSWVLNESTACWDSPIEIPSDGKRYNWNEETQNWDAHE